MDWGARPLRTISALNRFRATLSHGKPEIVDRTFEGAVEPEVWGALRSQREMAVTPDFVNRCRTVEDMLWETMLEGANTELSQTPTHGGYSLRTLIEPGD